MILKRDYKFKFGFFFFLLLKEMIHKKGEKTKQCPIGFEFFHLFFNDISILKNIKKLRTNSKQKIRLELK